ncbi:DUF4362 domain-containing protein [Paenibacillus sp. HB172176]|uniref:DUF4362 domain-containing protein n=1 Tax=Paenibacillus sp. HB172176 TaxID=2493690 RepID=UPI00143B48A8|nr:DUF4362 domain-containing protein [Paenibacillus sp. HB172176]
MRKLAVLVLSAVLLGSVMGCATNNSSNYGETRVTTGTPEGTMQPGIQLQETGDAEERVTVYRAVDFRPAGGKPYVVFTEEEALESFRSAIQSAERIKGILNVMSPQYIFKLSVDGEVKAYNLWLGDGGDSDKQGMIMDTADTHTGYTLTLEATRELYALIWNAEYNAETAAANGDVVNSIFDGYHNLHKWDAFVEHAKSGVKDEVQVVHYTVEGDPIFNNLSFDGEWIVHQHDTSHDAYGASRISRYQCKAIDQEEIEQSIAYTLSGCVDVHDDEVPFRLVIPEE